MKLQGLSNLGVGIYLQAMYNKGCEELNLEDTMLNREAFLSTITKVLTENLILTILEGAAKGDPNTGEAIDELLDTLAGAGGVAPLGPPMRQTASPLGSFAQTPPSDNSGEVLKDETEGSNFDIPLFNSEDFVN